MGFSNPTYWVWLLGVPVTLAILYLVYRRVGGLLEAWFGQDEYARSLPFTKTLLRAGAFVALFLALMGPYWGEADDDLPLLSRDIYILLDVSASMNTKDVSPSRLEYAKGQLKQLIRDFQGDNFGLIIFSDFAYVQCPLTRDYEVMETFLDMAKTEQFAQNGTRFRPALSKALERFQKQVEGGEIRSRAVILVSDGEDFGDTYASLVERMKNLNIKVFTVGVGTYEGDVVPNLTATSNRAGVKTLPDGRPAISRLLDEDLRYISESFDTDYVLLEEQGDNLSPLRRQIKQLSASPVAAQLLKVQQDRYQVFLFLAIILLFISLFLMPIRKI
ncbi:MAG: VWA domain-containing protein [Bacteroidota bacterium]